MYDHHRHCTLMNSATFGASRTCSFACKAALRDVGSDTGTFYGKKAEEGMRQLDENESVMLGEGDTVGFGPGESEQYRQAGHIPVFFIATATIPAVEVENIR